MGLLSSIFGNAPAQNQQAPGNPASPPNPNQAQNQQQLQAQSTPGNIPAGTGMPATPLPNTAPNGTVPEQTSETTQLDEFADLWKTTPVDPAAPVKDTRVFGEVNGDELLKTAGTIDFTKAITPEIAQRIAAGGEDGIRATMEAMNKTSQLVYAQSAHATTKLIEQGIAKAKDSFMSELPTHIRNSNASAAMKETPAYQHPAAQPLIEAAISQMQVKYPNATSNELRDMANRYITTFAAAVTPKAKVEPGKAGTEEQDFSNFLI